MEKDYNILLETNGSLNIADLSPQVIKIMDWKTPGSGEGGSFDMENLKHLTPEDELKFVLSSPHDFQWAKARIDEYDLTQKCKVLMSVVKDKFDPAELCELILQANLNVRFQLQLHKYIWPEEEKGR